MKNPIIHRSRACLALTFSLLLTAIASATNVVEKLSTRPEFSTLVDAVTQAGLVDALAEAEGITLFAPSNAAFAKIPAQDLEALLADKAALTRVLSYHVATAEVPFSRLESGPLDTLLPGHPVDVSVRSFYGGWFRIVEVDDARITRANLRASNGIIHRIDSVLDPTTEPVPSILEIAAGNPDFSTLAELVTLAGFDRALGSDRFTLTVFAPTNAAFEKLGAETLAAVRADRRLLREILRNHLAYGSLDSEALGAAGSVRTLLRRQLPIMAGADSLTTLAVDGKPIDAIDIQASNGIVHVVGEVLVPAEPKSLVDLAAGRDELSTLVEVLGLAGLAETLDSTRRWPAFTVFAPDNAAFGAVPEEALNSLLADPTGALAEVLKRHVVRGRITAEHLYDGQVLRSLSGERLEVSVAEDGSIRINNALVGEPDLTAENGILHIVRDVISPATFTIADFVASKPYLSTLNAALEAAELTGALADPDAALTLFAPMDFAFNRLPDGTLDDLLENPKGPLTQILLYHVLGETLDAAALVDQGTATTLQGGELEIRSRTFRIWGWRVPYQLVWVNGNRVITADIETDNGIVHLIVGVLMPPAAE